MNIFRFSLLFVLFIAAVSLVSCDEDQETPKEGDAVLGPLQPVNPVPSAKP